MPTFDGKEVTRAQLLARIAWYEFEHGWEVASDDWKPRTYVEQQMHGVKGWYDMTDDELAEALTGFCDFDGPEPLRPDWDKVDADHAVWARQKIPGPLDPDDIDLEMKKLDQGVKDLWTKVEGLGAGNMNKLRIRALLMADAHNLLQIINALMRVVD